MLQGAAYCGRECQLAAWPSHKVDCQRLVAVAEAGAAATAAPASPTTGKEVRNNSDFRRLNVLRMALHMVEKAKIAGNSSQMESDFASDLNWLQEMGFESTEAEQALTLVNKLGVDRAAAVE